MIFLRYEIQKKTEKIEKQEKKNIFTNTIHINES